MSVDEFDTFELMKNQCTSNKVITKEQKDKIIKNLDKMRKILSKNKRKPTQKEKIV